MELPTSNRKKVIDIWLTGLVAKNDPVSVFWKVISRKPLDLHRGKFSQNFFRHNLQISSKSESGLANLAKNWLIWHGMTHVLSPLCAISTFNIIVNKWNRRTFHPRPCWCCFLLSRREWRKTSGLGHQGSVIAKHGLNTTVFYPNQGMGDRDWRMRKWSESAESPKTKV